MKINKYFSLIFTTVLLFACSDDPSDQEIVSTTETIISDEYIWDLTDLYPDLDAWILAKDQVAHQIQQLAELQGTLDDSAEKLLCFRSNFINLQRSCARLRLCQP